MNSDYFSSVEKLYRILPRYIYILNILCRMFEIFFVFCFLSNTEYRIFIDETDLIFNRENNDKVYDIDAN